MFQSDGDNLSLTDSLSLGSASVGGHQHSSSDQGNHGKHVGQGGFCFIGGYEGENSRVSM